MESDLTVDQGLTNAALLVTLTSCLEPPKGLQGRWINQAANFANFSRQFSRLLAQSAAGTGTRLVLLRHHHRNISHSKNTTLTTIVKI